MSDAAKDAAEELGDLFPEPETVQICGKSVRIGILSIRRLGAVAKALAPLMGALEGENGPTIDLRKIVAKHADDAVTVLAAAINEPAEWVGELPGDQFFDLAKRVFEANRGFFFRQLIPTAAMLVQMAAPSHGDGQTSSSTSATAESPTRKKDPPRPRPGLSMRALARSAGNAARG